MIEKIHIEKVCSYIYIHFYLPYFKQYLYIDFQSLDKLALKLSQKKISREEKIKAIYNIQYQIDSLERSIHI